MDAITLCHKQARPNVLCCIMMPCCHFLIFCNRSSFFEDVVFCNGCGMFSFPVRCEAQFSNGQKKVVHLKYHLQHYMTECMARAPAPLFSYCCLIFMVQILLFETSAEHAPLTFSTAAQLQTLLTRNQKRVVCFFHRVLSSHTVLAHLH